MVRSIAPAMNWNWSFWLTTLDVVRLPHQYKLPEPSLIAITMTVHQDVASIGKTKGQAFWMFIIMPAATALVVVIYFTA